MTMVIVEMIDFKSSCYRPIMLDFRPVCRIKDR